MGRVFSEEHKRKIGASHIGRVCSKEHLDRLRKAATGRKVSQETRNKMSNSHKGRINSDKNLQILKEKAEERKNTLVICDVCNKTVSKTVYYFRHGKNCGKNICTEEGRKKVSQARKNSIGKYGKPVLQFTENWEFIAEFVSGREASKATGVPVKVINKRTLAHKKGENMKEGKVFKFKWKYKE